MRRALIPFLAAGLLFSCADDAPSDKGAEENALTGGKEDSFYRPTEHGTLRFGPENPATVTDDEQFHAWTFELSDTAKLDISTSVSQNLDTVLYLYHRAPGADSWGRYIEKNDDDGDKISSRVTVEGAAGEYRIIVKPFKSALRGSFTVAASCDGAGCVQSTDSCDADTFADMPRSRTSMSQTCASKLMALLESTAVSSSGGETYLHEKCDLVGLERTAIDFYHEYWSGYVDFEEQFGGWDDEGIMLYFSKEEFSSGTVITVDAGGDEDGLSMYFDEDDTLLAAYQHNQSPMADFYCADGDIEPPDEYCFEGMMNSLDDTDATDLEFGDATIGDLEAGDDALAAISKVFAADFGLDADASVTHEVRTWDNGDVVEANMVYMDGSRQYVARSVYRGWQVLYAVDANGYDFVCESP